VTIAEQFLDEMSGDARYLYGIDAREGGVWRISKSDGQKVLLANEGHGGFEDHGLVIDGEFVYWLTGEEVGAKASGALFRVSKQGGKPTRLASFAGVPGSLALTESEVFFSTRPLMDTPFKPEPIRAVSKKGGRPRVVAAARSASHLMFVGDDLYWWRHPYPRYSDDRGIERLRKGAKKAELVIGPVMALYGDLTFRGNQLYGVIAAPGEDTWSFEIASLDFDTTTSPDGPSDFRILYSNARTFVMDETHFYWLNREELVAAPLDRSSPPVVLARKRPEDRLGGPHDCFFGGAMHVDDQHVYWSPLARVCRISKRPPHGP
jgi:hypothetical protein